MEFFVLQVRYNLLFPVLYEFLLLLKLVFFSDKENDLVLALDGLHVLEDISLNELNTGSPKRGVVSLAVIFRRLESGRLEVVAVHLVKTFVHFAGFEVELVFTPVNFRVLKVLVRNPGVSITHEGLSPFGFLK